MQLTATNVIEKFMKCLFKDGEATENFIKAEGVMSTIGFNPDRLKENQPDIDSMILELPDEFMKSKGGGMSFLNACNDKNGQQWADMHQTIDQLLCLGLATGKITMLMPREMWSVLPGGMPYFIVND